MIDQNKLYAERQQVLTGYATTGWVLRSKACRVYKFVAILTVALFSTNSMAFLLGCRICTGITRQILTRRL